MIGQPPAGMSRIVLVPRTIPKVHEVPSALPPRPAHFLSTSLAAPRLGSERRHKTI